MKRKLSLLFGGLIAIVLIARAQKPEEKKPASKPKPVPVYAGTTGLSGGSVAKSTFDELVRQKFTSKDSLGKSYVVDGFVLTYAERGYYEDSVGKLMILTDYLSEVCYGDTLTKFLRNILIDRTKKGDTVIFDQITVRAADGKGLHGKPMKFVIDR